MNKINVIILPSVVFISLVLGGCTKDEVTVTPSGGVYVSASAGANFDQSVQTTITGEDISQFDLGKIHRALQDANTVFMAAGEKGMVRSKDRYCANEKWCVARSWNRYRWAGECNEKYR